MAVYVDTSRHSKWNMIMSHMIADTRRELDEMVEKLELQQRYKQDVGGRNEHFDIAQSKVKAAVHFGAKRISVRELVVKLRERDMKEYLEDGYDEP